MTISFLQIADENRFFIIFLLVNGHRRDVLVTANLSGQLEVNRIKPTKMLSKSKIVKTRTSLTLTAIDAITNQTVNINGKSVVYLEPIIEKLLSLRVLHITGKNYWLNNRQPNVMLYRRNECL